MNRRLTAIVAVLTVAAFAPLAGAAISGLTNGDFETNAANSPAAFPTPWYSSSDGLGSWEDFRYAGLGGYPGTAAALGYGAGNTQTGYIYQTVGTYAGESTVTLDGTAYNRASTNFNHVFGDMDVAFYYTSGSSFSPATGSDVASSGTLVGTVQEFQEGVNLPGLASGGTPTSSAFSHTASFVGSGISVGDEVWVRIGDSNNVFGLNAGVANDEPYFDNLSVSAEGGGVVVPAPAALPAGLAMLIAVASRRRRNA